MPDTIFIDTSVYRSHHFHFDSPRFRSLITLAEHGHIRLLTTDVTIQEVHANLDELIDEALAPINKALAGGSVLQRARTYSLVAAQPPLKEEDARKELHDGVDSFFRQPGFTTLSTSAIASGRILTQYFRREAPFGAGKKKSEFPDAFAAAAIVDWAAAEQTSVVIVAEDGDWEAMCETHKFLSHARALSVVVESLLKEEEKAGVLKAHSIVSRFPSEIASAVAEQLVHQWAYLEDVDGEVLSIDPGESEVVAARVVAVTGPFATVEVEVSSAVSFEVSYDDPTSWIYDSEDKVAYYMNRIETTLERDLSLEAELTLCLEGDADEPPDIQSVTLNQDRRTGIIVDEYDSHH